MRQRLTTLIILGFWLMACQDPTAATQEPRGKVQEVPPPPTLVGIPCKQINVGREIKFLPDLVLLDQNGRRVRFYSDLIKDKTVLLSFFYTSCASTCLMQGKVFSEIQAELGGRLGNEVFLISVTMDPDTDTPERLRSWAKQNGLRSGWTLVTGGKAEIAKLVGHLTGNPLGRIELHSPFIYLGNDKKNKWAATYGLAAPKNLVKQIDDM